MAACRRGERTSHPGPRARASIATIALCEPASFATAVISEGSAIAAVFIETLSAPARSSASASSTRPHAASHREGDVQLQRDLLDEATSVPRASSEALMSRKQSSSAPAAP